jgi:hypothetical protein
MIEGDFGHAKGSEAVGFSHSDFGFVVQPLDYATGESLSGAEIVDSIVLSR